MRLLLVLSGLVTAICFAPVSTRAQCASPADAPQYNHVQSTDAFGSVNVHVRCNDALVSRAWIDASLTATTTVTVPATGALGPQTSRVGLHVWNLGTTTVCMNFTGAPSVSGAACAAGSVPIPPGGTYFEDQPGNVSNEPISFLAISGTDALTVKVR